MEKLERDFPPVSSSSSPRSLWCHLVRGGARGERRARTRERGRERGNRKRTERASFARKTQKRQKTGREKELLARRKEVRDAAFFVLPLSLVSLFLLSTPLFFFVHTIDLPSVALYRRVSLISLSLSVSPATNKHALRFCFPLSRQQRRKREREKLVGGKTRGKTVGFWTLFPFPPLLYSPPPPPPPPPSSSQTRQITPGKGRKTRGK